MADPSAFSMPSFRRFWMARLLSNLAQNALAVVIAWQAYDIARQTMDPKHAAMQLGLIGALQFLPLIPLTLVAGWASDRFDRRIIAAISLGIDLLSAVILAVMTLQQAVTLPLLFGIAVLLGAARAFSGPSFGAMVANIVPVAVLPAAIASSSLALEVGSIVGPAMGGYLYAYHPAAPYLTVIVLFVLTILGVLMITTWQQQPAALNTHPLRQIVAGLRYVLHHKLLLGAISLDLFAVLLGGATAMLPVYARDVLHTGPEGLGHLRAAPAVGAALMAFWLGVRPIESQVGKKLLLAVAGFGVMTICFGLSSSMLWSLACLFGVGALDMISVYIRQSLTQIHTPDVMRGRVASVSTVFISGSNEMGEAESGFAAALVGPVASVVIGGAGAILIAALWWKYFPEIRRAERFSDAAPT